MKRFPTNYVYTDTQGRPRSGRRPMNPLYGFRILAGALPAANRSVNGTNARANRTHLPIDRNGVILGAPVIRSPSPLSAPSPFPSMKAP